jgi:TetR/AcrR family tetracycline transcriptional repressor
VTVAGKEPAAGAPDMRERILDTATRMIEEEEAADGLSMRKLAAELGVAPTAIYWHVGNRRELLDQLVTRMIAGVGVPQPAGETPLERMASIARWIREKVLARPHLVSLAHERGRTAELYFPAQSALAREISAAGLEGPEAALAVRTVLFFVGGFIMVETSELVSPHLATGELWSTAGIDADLAAHLAEDVDFDELFEHSLAALLRAVTAGDVAARRP